MKLIGNKNMFVLLNILSLLLLFASGQAFAWTQTATFESGANGANASGSSGFSVAGTRTTFSTDMAHSGTKSAKMVWNARDEGYSADNGEFDYPSGVGTGKEIWVRGYYYFPAGWKWDNGTASQYIKMLRIRTNGANYVSWFARGTGQVMYDNEIADYQINVVSGGNSIYWDTGRWQCIELYLKLGNPGIVRMWKDGVLILQDTSHTTGSNADLSYIMSQWNGGPGQNQNMYVDDFIVTSDTPSGRDAAGNPMIGLTSATGAAPPQPPTGLRVTP